MSLTDEVELQEMHVKPKIKKHNPNFIGDGEVCDFNTGHCSNTDACHDCKVYQSVERIKEYEARLKGD